MTSLIRFPIRRRKILCLVCFVTGKLSDFPCVFGANLFIRFFKILAVSNMCELFLCNDLKKMKPTVSYFNYQLVRIALCSPPLCA